MLFRSSLMTLPEVLDGVLRTAGSSLEAELELLPLEPAFRYAWPDGPTLDLHADADATLASVRAALGPDAERELAAFLAYARDIWDAAAPRFVFAEAPSALGLLKLGVSGLAAVTRIDGMRGMTSAIHGRVRTPHLRDVLLRFATYNGSDARVAPATLNCIAHVELGLRGWGVRGGMYEVVRALTRTAERLGVELCTNRPARRIEGRRRVEGVDGERCDFVVVNADVGALVEGLIAVDPPPRATVTPRSMSGWNAVVRARRADRAGHAVLFPASNYLDEFAAIFDRRRAPAEPAVYVCAQEVAHARRGWDDAEPVFLMVNAPADADVEGVEDLALARLRSAGWLTTDDTVVWRRTPRELAGRFPGSHGALYGAASNSAFSAFRRPANRGHLPGLYLASGSAHPGGGVPLCLQSGRQAAREVLADLGAS